MGMTFGAQDFATTGIPLTGSLTGGVAPQATAPTSTQYNGGQIYNPQVEGATTTVSNAGSYPSGSSAPLNTAAITNTQKNIDQLPLILQMALTGYQQAHDNANGTLDAQQAQEQGKYDTGTVTNQQNYDSNLMAALRSGANGLGGLLSILRGTGAEGWAKNAVQDTTNSDIRTGLDTRDQNQTGLDTSLSSTLTDLRGKREQNDATLQNNQFAARSNHATQLQDLYKTMAGFYSDAGNTGEATRFMNMAGDQAPEVARYSSAPVAAFDSTPVAVKSAPVTAFSGPTTQNVTANDGNNGSNAGIFTLGDARKRLAGAGA